MSHRAKLARARKHLDEVATLGRAYLASNPYAYVGHHNTEAGEFIAKATVKHRIPHELSIAIGDVLFNMRSALDHIAWELAPDGADSTQLEFPIFHDSADYGKRGLKKIRLLPQRAQAVIESLQPYHGGNATDAHPLWLLHKLNNVDKHRSLLAAGAISDSARLVSIAGNMNGHPGMVTINHGAFDDGTVLFRVKMPPSAYGAEMRMEFNAHYTVAFAKEGPARGAPVSILPRIHDHIRDVVFPAIEPLL